MDKFEATIQQLDGYVLYGAEWCTACNDLKDYADTGQLERLDVNVDDDPDVSERAGIKKLPTLQIWTAGVLQSEYIGATAIKEAIRPPTFDELSEQDQMLELMPDF